MYLISIGILSVYNRYLTSRGTSSMAGSVSNGYFIGMVIELVSHHIQYFIGITSVYNNRYLISIGISWVATTSPFHKSFIHIGIRSAYQEFPSLLGISFISDRCLIGGFCIGASSVSVSHHYRYLIGIGILSVGHITLSVVFESTETSTIPEYQRLNINASTKEWGR